MPRKRRAPKVRLEHPTGLAQISKCERTWWQSQGPLLEADVDERPPCDLYHVWESWDAWATFYGEVRDEIHGDRPWLRETSVAEQLYQAWLRGEDLDRLRAEITNERAAEDPRQFLEVDR